MNVVDYSILARIRVTDDTVQSEYLHDVSGEWKWLPTMDGAKVFKSHAEAESAAAQHRYQDDSGKWHTPWPLVIGQRAPVVAEREGRRRDPVATMEASVPASRHVTPTECFAELERRGLA